MVRWSGEGQVTKANLSLTLLDVKLVPNYDHLTVVRVIPLSHLIKPSRRYERKL